MKRKLKVLKTEAQPVTGCVRSEVCGWTMPPGLMPDIPEPETEPDPPFDARQKVGTSHDGRFTYYLDPSDRYIYQFDETESKWIGWLCTQALWDKGFCAHIDRWDLCPICGERVRLIGETTDGRLIGSCRDAFTRAQWETRCLSA